MQLNEDDFEDVLESARSLLSADDEADLWEASELVNRALSLRPDDREAWMLKAQVLSALEDDHAAFAAIEMAVSRAPECAEAHYWRAAILCDLSRPKEALRAVDRAFRELTPDDDWLVEDLYCEKATTLETLGRTDDAIASYREGLSRFPGSTLLSLGLAPLQKQSLRASLRVIDGGLQPIRRPR